MRDDSAALDGHLYQIDTKVIRNFAVVRNTEHDDIAILPCFERANLATPAKGVRPVELNRFAVLKPRGCRVLPAKPTLRVKMKQLLPAANFKQEHEP